MDNFRRFSNYKIFKFNIFAKKLGTILNFCDVNKKCSVTIFCLNTVPTAMAVNSHEN